MEFDGDQNLKSDKCMLQIDISDVMAVGAGVGRQGGSQLGIHAVKVSLAINDTDQKRLHPALQVTHNEMEILFESQSWLVFPIKQCFHFYIDQLDGLRDELAFEEQ